MTPGPETERINKTIILLIVLLCGSYAGLSQGSGSSEENIRNSSRLIEETPIDDSDHVKSIKRAVKEVFEVTLANDADRFSEAFHPDKRDQAQKQLQRMQQIISMTKNLTFSPMIIIMYVDTDATVISKQFEPNHPAFNNDIVMVCFLKKHEEQWKVIQFGASMPNMIPDFYSYDEKQRTVIKYWLDPDTPNWLRPPQDLQTDKSVEQLESISKSFQKELAERRKKLIEKVERMAGGMEIFESYFPVSNSGAEKLDKWWPERAKNGQVDENYLTIIRNGLRVDTQGNPRKNKNRYIQWVAQKYIGRTKVQDPNAIDLIYHASFDSKLAYDCVYHGLSTIRPENRTEKILKRLTELAMADISTGRIHWGTKGSHENILKHLQPYLDSSDSDISVRAQLLEKVFKGELDYDKWRREQYRQQIDRKFTHLVKPIREVLISGSSKQRRDALQSIRRSSLSEIFDESFAEPIKLCLQDEDPEVRKMAMKYIGLFGKRGQYSDEILALMDKLSNDSYFEVRRQAATFIGRNWIWNVHPQNTKAIEILIRLAIDKDHETRHNASYWGLSRVRDPNAVKYLINVAISEQDKDSDIYKIICWIHQKNTSAKKVIQQYIDTETDRKESAIKLYKDAFGEDPK
ncbi:MAG: HEAT repeat domain-containing protein [Planctomycetota bacterium]